MNPIFTEAIAHASQMSARQVVVVLFDDDGEFAVLACGKSRSEFKEVQVLGDAIADRLESGELPTPAENGRG